MNFYIVHEREDGYSADCIFIDTPAGIFWKYSEEENTFWEISSYANVNDMLQQERSFWKVTVIPWSESTDDMRYDVYEWLLS